jgi:predicted alpha/beta superfamily hydrolase
MLQKIKIRRNLLIHIWLCSVFFLAAPMAAAEELKSFSIPSTSIHTLNSEKLGRSYDVFVKTPIGYDDPKNAELVYPVIYLNDGPYTFQVASGVTHLPMGGSHKFERAILVGISFAKGEAGMASRVRDLTPLLDEDWKEYQTGGAPAYLSFIADEVIPFVEGSFRADPAKRTLSGQSLGGSFGAWVLLARPGIFSSYILTSPSLWYKDRFIFDLEEAYAASQKDLHAAVYFAVGEMETLANGMRNPMVSQLVEFGEILQSRHYPNLDIKVEVIPGAIHETTFPQGFTRGAHWIYGRK